MQIATNKAISEKVFASRRTQNMKRLKNLQGIKSGNVREKDLGSKVGNGFERITKIR